MPGSTEIYICEEGQSLKEGKLEYSSNIETRGEAEDDARQRCRSDPSIAKVAYYAMTEDGSFSNLFTYRNPNPVTRGNKPAQLGSAAPDAGRHRKADRPERASLLSRIVDFYREE